ncbi:hypothetical protein GCM10010404_30240 [Nonomuraea africana]|uniref:Uncharacterized protein n=1 Tax=Nonomuraea africana TaxID=46171 RepID=A0ABR9KGG5_9ACTN|nr:hypothetical protein [Nonomuraea africana]MBE1560743.1 hypothetical protein [Nonomuraea africana]
MQRLDQIFYTWSERSLLGGKGMGPVASSLPVGALAGWDPVLRGRVWAGWQEHDRFGLGYLRGPDGYAVICKRPVTEAEGRQASLAHVLVGREITPLGALALHDWDGWLTAWDGTAELDPLSWEDLRRQCDLARRDLVGRARRLPAATLAELVAFVLAEPEADVSVVAPTESPAELLCALVEITGAMTFSTMESRDDDRGCPRVVFLPDDHDSRMGVPRRRFRFGSGGADPFALALATSYRAEGRAAIDRIRPQTPVTTADEARAWARAAQLAPGVLDDITGLLRRASDLSAAELGALRSKQGLAEARRIVPALEDGALAALLRASGLPEEVSALAQECALRSFLTGRAGEQVLAALAIRPPPARLIGEQLKHAPPLGRVAALARQALPDVRERRDLLDRAARQLSKSELIAWVHDHCRDEPEAAHVALRVICDGQERSAEQRRRALDTLIARGALAEATAELTPSPREAAAYLQSVLTVVAGARIDEPLMASFLARSHPPAHLLYALRAMAGDSRALALADRTAWGQFFTQSGLPAPLGAQPVASRAQPGPADERPAPRAERILLVVFFTSVVALLAVVAIVVTGGPL